MNWHRIEGKWLQLRGNVKVKWGKIADDHWTIVAGRRDQRAGKIQESYGIGKDQAERRLRDWKRCNDRSAYF